MLVEEAASDTAETGEPSSITPAEIPADEQQRDPMMSDSSSFTTTMASLEQIEAEQKGSPFDLGVNPPRR